MKTVHGIFPRRTRFEWVTASALLAVGYICSAAAADDDANSPSANQAALEEVTVTAQKYAEKLGDVPAPVTVIQPGDLISNNMVSLQDYFTQVPGLNFTTGGLGGVPKLTIRGLSNGTLGEPTTGILIDDVPYGSAIGQFGQFEGAPDLDPADLQQIEVLRGPQGTLYGASGLGGLIKYDTLAPSTSSFGGHVQLGGASVENGDGIDGYSVRAGVNVPLTQSTAMRISGFDRRDPGWINNPVLDEHDVNRARFYGGHLSFLWQISDNTYLRLGALYQDENRHGADDVEPALGEFAQNYPRTTGAYHFVSELYSAKLETRVGRVVLTSLTGYSIANFDSALYLGGSTALANYGHTGTVTQELRAAAKIFDNLDLLVGGFFTHENNEPLNQTIWTLDPQTGAFRTQILTLGRSQPENETAGFADLTWRITHRFDVQVGGRESAYSLKTDSTTMLPGSPTTAEPFISTDSKAFTYLMTSRYHFNDDFMAYVRFSPGYRVGQPNIDYQIALGPPSYSPDKTVNYEVGLKGEALERRLSFDTSAYYIDWKNIQVQVSNPNAPQGFAYITNAGEAKSEGFEATVSAVPWNGMTVSTWIAYNFAVLTIGFPSTSSAYGVSGTPLPFSSRWSGSVSLDQDFPMGVAATGNVGVSMSYVGERFGDFTSDAAAPRDTFPSYNQLNVHAGLIYDSWQFNLAINNISDSRGVLAAGHGFSGDVVANYITPRLISFSLTKKF
jgi:iron complex outermembrane recepter protein